MDKQEILESIRSLFGDTTVSPQETRRDLEEIRDLCETLIQTLPESDE